jgi:hypothetical protein
VTRHFPLALIVASFGLLIYTQDIIALSAFTVAVLLKALLTVLPFVFESGEEKLRKEFSADISKLVAEMEVLKNRMDVVTLRGPR